jgi:uncharacterized protein YuzE
MKLHDYPETDSLYIELEAAPGAGTREVVPGLNVDLDVAGDVVGFDIDGVSRLDLTTRETIKDDERRVKGQEADPEGTLPKGRGAGVRGVPAPPRSERFRNAGVRGYAVAARPSPHGQRRFDDRLRISQRQAATPLGDAKIAS